MPNVKSFERKSREKVNNTPQFFNIIKTAAVLFVTSFLFFGFTIKAQATAYYVDNTIANTEIGSATPDCANYSTSTYTCSNGSASAFATIADINAFSGLAAGDSVLFRKGQIWRERLAVPSSGTALGGNINFGAYGSGADPIISGADLDDKITGWAGPDGNGEYYKTYATPPRIVFGNSLVLTKGTVGSLAATEWGYNGSNLYLGQNPTTYITLEVGQRNSCITFNGKNYITTDSIQCYGSQFTGAAFVLAGGYRVEETSTNITINNPTIHDVFGHGIQVQKGTNITVNGGSIYDIYGDVSNHGDAFIVRNGTNGISSQNVTVNGLSVTGTMYRDGIVNVGCDNFIVKNVSVTASSPNGAAIDFEPQNGHSSDNGIVEDSVLHPMAGDAVQAGGADVDGIILRRLDIDLYNGNYSGIYISGITGTAKILDNKIINVGDKASISIAHATVSVLRNWIENNAESTYGAMSFGTGAVGTVAYNIVKNSITALRVDGATTAINFYNNTLIDYKNGFSTGNLAGNTSTLKNNIFYDSGTAPALQIYVGQNVAVTTILDYNLYFPDGASLFRWSGKNYTTFANYRTASGQDAHSLIANPLFTNTAGNDFTLQSASPAIDVGVNLGSDYDDGLSPASTWPSSVATIDQNLRGSGWEIGAYIYSVPQAPKAPTIGAPSVITSSSIRWNFTDNSDDETGFLIYNSANELITSSATTNLSYLDETGLSENTQYSGRYVTAYNGYGNSVSSLAATTKYTLADTPTNLSASSNSNSVALTADNFPNDTIGSSGYYFSRSGGGNSGWRQTNSWSDSGLACGTSYAYSVIYRNGDGIETTSISTTKSTSECGGGGGNIPANQSNPPITPVGGFKVFVNSGASIATNRIVNLSFNVGPDIKKMTISLTGDFNDASQENYSPTKQIDLCSKLGGLIKNPTCPDGQYTVYVKFYNQYERASDVVSQKINLVTTPQFSKPAIIFTKELRLGSKDIQVKTLQKFLNQNGFKLANSDFGSPGNETDYFGSLTLIALAKFQEANKAKVAGLVNEKGYLGPITREFINSSTNSTVPAEKPADLSQLPSAIFTTPLYRGLQSEDVRRLQKLLATKPEIYPEGLVTGYFGPLTEKAVQTFQLKYGVVSSKSDSGFGLIGPKTRAKLQEVFGN